MVGNTPRWPNRFKPYEANSIKKAGAKTHFEKKRKVIKREWLKDVEERKKIKKKKEVTMSRSVPIRHDPFFEWKSPLQLLDSFGLKSRGDFHHEEDVHGFKENEIDVRVLGNKVSIHCLHEDANNRREINKSFYLPDDVDSATVRSHLSHSGSTLTVTAHKKEQSQSAFGAAHGGATRIPVQHEPKFGVGSLLSSHQRKNFEVDLDVHQFAPHEIQVKVSGNDVIIHCLHDGKDGGEVVKREINRTYRLPDDIDPYTVKSNLSNTGMLTITAQNKY